jgi:hypothetical protein
MCAASVRLAGCLLIPVIVLAATSAGAQNGTQASRDAGALVEVLTQPGPPGRVSQGYFEDNPGCINAKLDIWFARGRHTHQAFMPRTQPAFTQPEGAPGSKQTREGDTANAPIEAIMNENGTTIIVGREGCRIRVRIDRAE